jgi:hypothetical protein
MGRGLLKAHLRCFENVGEKVDSESDWNRDNGHDKKYEFSDAIKGAYGLFLFQHPSMLDYQEDLKRENRRKNTENILGVKKVPCNNQITRLLDVINPDKFGAIFNKGIEMAERYGALQQYKVLNGRLLVALDGVWFYESNKIHCEHCLHITKGGNTRYFHDMIAAAIVKPGNDTVLSLAPEFIRNEDGMDGDKNEQEKKQDCERSAAKRFLDKHADEYNWLRPVYLGDDLYANYNICTAIIGHEQHFIFTCKPDSHKWLEEMVKYSFENVKEVRVWDGRNHIIYRYKWVNQVEIREELPTLNVNYLELEVRNVEKDIITYKNSWITDLTISDANVIEMSECGRARWKIENEHNNVLKNRGYHLEHNFGHGHNHACDVYAVLNLLAFQLHSIMLLLDENYQQSYHSFNRRDKFFNAMRFILAKLVFDDLDSLIAWVNIGPPDR